MRAFDDADPAVVWGLGTRGGGAAAVRQLARQGFGVTVVDRATEADLEETLATLPDGVTLRLGEDDPTPYLTPDATLVVNPAVPPSHAAWPGVRAGGCRLTSPLGLLLRELVRRPVVAVTGSNGKSTLTAWAANALNAVGVPATVGGNFECDLVGLEPLPDRLESLPRGTVFVLELSSFQLAYLFDDPFAPQVGVVTNCTPNHLDWHGTFEAYADAKATVLRRATESRVPPIPPDDPLRRRFWPDIHRAVPSAVGSKPDGPDDWPPHVRELAGMVRWIVSDFADGISDAALAAARPSLPHRFQTVREDRAAGGLRWVDDSAATTPESVAAALDRCGEPPVLILGGRNKGFDLDALAREVAPRCEAVATIGETAGDLAKLIAVHGGKVRSHRTLAKAVKWSGKVCRFGGTVLLSPGMASADLFRDYRHRGREFARLAGQSRGPAESAQAADSPRPMQ